LQAGGAVAIKLLVGVVLAFAFAAFFVGVPYELREWLWRLSLRGLLRRLTDAFGITLAGQVTVAMAYAVICWQWLPHGVPIEKFVAATFVIMFAASLPISFAGFGIRELGAVYILGKLGIPSHYAALTAVTIGVISLLLPVILLWLERVCSQGRAPAAIRHAGSSISLTVPHVNWHLMLAWALPLLTAVLVFFQIRAQRGMGGEINLNLADPFALMGGALFIIHFLKKKCWPRWGPSSLIFWITAASAMLIISFANGYFRYGLIPWALNNRLIGWLVLMGYFFTGGYLFIQAHINGRLAVLKALVGAASAIALVEIVARWMFVFGWLPAGLGVVGSVAEGFAQNRNAFAFQMIIALGCAMALFASATDERQRNILALAMALCITAIIQTFSRSGFIILPILVIMALWMKLTPWRYVFRAAFLVCVFLISMGVVPAMSLDVSADTSITERMQSILGGLHLWIQSPLFGAGLGAFIYNWMLTHPIPLVIHNSWVWMLAEMGVAGFVAFTGLLSAMFYYAWQTRHQWESRLVILLLISFGLISLVHEMLYQRLLWLALGVMLISDTHSSNTKRGPQ
jgi:hypothetical protein